MLTYFAKNNEIGNTFAQKGYVIPIGRINLNYYFVGVFYSVSDIPHEYKIEHQWKKFNLSVGEDRLVWVTSLGLLENWNSLYYQNLDLIKDKNVFTSENIPKDTNIAARFEVDKGNYEVKIYGIKNASKEREGRFGYFFILNKVDKLLPCNDATEIDFNKLNQE